MNLAIPPDRARRWVIDVFRAVGLERDDAETVADQLVSDDLRGVLSHGLIRVPNYVSRIEGGAVDARGRPEVAERLGATAVVDGHNAMGQVVAADAMRVAVDLASEYGTGSVVARRSNHFGTCAHFALMAVPHGMIGIAATVSAGNIMAPWGGLEALLGNNPYGIAVPALDHPPLVVDVSFSVAAGGKILLAAQRGEQIPDTWAIGADGLPETDPVRAAKDLLVRPLGDHKGYALALQVAVLSAILPNAAFGRDVRNMRADFETPQDVGHWFQALDIRHFSDPLAFRQRIDRAIDVLHGARRAPGVDRILVPGEREAQTRARQEHDGIEYPIALLRELNGVGRKLRVGAIAPID